MLVRLKPEKCTFREDRTPGRRPPDKWMHQPGHESTKHPGSVRFRSTIEIGAFEIEIVLQRLIDPLGDQLVVRSTLSSASVRRDGQQSYRDTAIGDILAGR